MRFVRPVAIFLLAFLALGAFVGAVPMIVRPYSNQWGVMPLSLLQYSPFHSYLIPGILLLVSNGLLPLWVLWLLLRRKPLYGLWVVFQGCVLLGFLTAECWLLQVVSWPHYLYASVALALMVCGLAMRRDSVGR
jgi:hypothetical protein